MKQKAFTVVELLVVITVLSVLTTVIALDFSRVRQAQSLDLMLKQSLAMMQQAQAKVSSGKADLENDETLCFGAYFEVGKIPRSARGIYDSETERCEDLITEDYGFNSDQVQVGFISIGASDLNAFWAMYRPPQADLLFYDEFLEFYSGSAEVNFRHVNGERMEVGLDFNYLTNQVLIHEQ